MIVITALVSCKKNDNTRYEVIDTSSYGDNLNKDKDKSNIEFHSILTTNLFQKPSSINELTRTDRVIQSCGDKTLINEVIISNYMNSNLVKLPSRKRMVDSTELFVQETYVRFFIRRPSEAEKTWFVNFINANTGFAGGGYIDVAGVIWKTIDGGMIWTADDYSAEPIYDIFIKNQNSIIAAGGDFEYGPQTCKSSDAGQSWTYELLNLFGQTYSLDFRTSAEGWMALGYSRTWAVSNDSGLNWTAIPTNDTSDYYAISFPDSLHGYAFGSGGSIMKYDPTITAVQMSGSKLPEDHLLKQNYPNPFNPVSNLGFGISEFGFVSLIVYDVLGNIVATLVNQRKSPGIYEVEFDGRGFSSGIYFYRLSVNGKIFDTKRMVLLK